MEQGTPPTLRTHLRLLPTYISLLLFDIFMLWRAVDRTLKRGPSAVIVFGFEYTILAAQMAATLSKYALHTIDLRDDQPWEDKSMIIFYLDLIVDFLKLLAYFVFFALVVHFYGIPLHIVRDLYFTLRSFIQRIRDLMRYRRATANMDTRYPDATVEDIAAGDGVCIICREEMVAGGVLPEGLPAAQAQAQQRSDRPKKLPCGHMFHFHCLRSWLERQQSCPTCRRSVLIDPPAPTTAPAAQPQQPAPGPQQPQGPFPYLPAAGFNGFFPGAQPPAAQQPPHQHPHVHGQGQGQLPPAPFPFAWPFPPPAPIPIPVDRLPPGVVAGGQGVFPIPGMPILRPGELGLGPDLDHVSDAGLIRLDNEARERIKRRLRELQRIEGELFAIATRMAELGSDSGVVGVAAEGDNAGSSSSSS